MTANPAAGLDGRPNVARLEVRNLSKTFGSSRALRQVAFRVLPGEIHGLVGENGSGKSTLVKIITGYHSPDPGGELLVDGERIRLPATTSELRRLGISVVHQDLGLADAFSVLENIRVGAFGVRRFTRMIRWRTERERVRSMLADLGFDIDPDALVGSLAAADRATVAIARALQHHDPGRGIIIFDESSRALPKDSLEHFHRLIRQAADRGTAIILISHQLEEVMAHSDRITVLRDGAVVGDGLAASSLSEQEVVKLMIGYELEGVTRTKSKARTDAAPIVTVQHVSGRLVEDASFSVSGGEILGITGLVGSGFEELPYLISGGVPGRGLVEVDGVEINLSGATCRQFLAAGVALVPERRDRDGLAMTLSIQDNIALPRLQSHGGPLYLGRSWQREDTNWVMRELGVRPPIPLLPVAHLSGGNQQKVLLGKWMRGNPKVLILHEPTQGVDVGARRDLFLAIGRAASAGCAVVVAAMDPNDLEAICDRLLVFREGVIAGELSDALTFDEIVEAVYGD